MTTTRLLLALLALLVAACSGAGSAPTAPPASAAPIQLDGRSFLSTAVTLNGATYPLLPDTRIRLHFIDGRLVASAGCNTLGGSYQVSNGLLQVTDLSMTEMGCDPARHAQDEWLGKLLGAKPAIGLTGNDLTLEQGGTLITLLDREIAEPDLPLTGIVWTVATIHRGDTVSTPPGNGIATLFFGTDGRVQVNTGCNTGSGTYTVDAAKGVLTFGPIGITKKACIDDTADLEQEVLSTVDGATAFSISGNALTIFKDQHGLQLQGAAAPTN